MLQYGHRDCGPLCWHISHSPQFLGDQYVLVFSFVFFVSLFALRRKVQTLRIINVMFLTVLLRTFATLSKSFFPFRNIEFIKFSSFFKSFRILVLFVVIVAGFIGTSVPELFVIVVSWARLYSNRLKVCIGFSGSLCFVIESTRCMANSAARTSLVRHSVCLHPYFLFFQFRSSFFGFRFFLFSS